MLWFHHLEKESTQQLINFTHTVSSEGLAWSSTRQVTVIHRCAAYLWKQAKDIWLVGGGRGKTTKTLWSYFWRFAMCPPAHMLKQHFFNKKSILTLGNYKIWYRKHQLQKLQLWTPKANCKSKVKHLLCQETTYLFETPKDWKADAFSLISKQYLPHPDPTLKPNTRFGEYALDTHQSFILQTWRISPISLHWQGQGHVLLTQWVARGGGHGQRALTGAASAPWARRTWLYLQPLQGG